MHSKKSTLRNLEVGDLVTHVLYGREWIGIIIDIKEEEGASPASRCQALVQIQPGTKFDGFFEKNTSKKNRINENLGYVSINWLFKVEKSKI